MQVQASEQSNPNIVFILVDDMGWKDLGCYGSTFYETPNIDQLAKSGVRFTDAYASAPLCSASRAAILTGWSPAPTARSNQTDGSAKVSRRRKRDGSR